MSEAPKEIWFLDGPEEYHPLAYTDNLNGGTSYTRTDIHEAALARIAELEAKPKVKPLVWLPTNARVCRRP